MPNSLRARPREQDNRNRELREAAGSTTPLRSLSRSRRALQPLPWWSLIPARIHGLRNGSHDHAATVPRLPLALVAALRETAPALP